MTLRQRLFLWYGGVLAVSGAILVFAVYFIIAHSMKTDFLAFLKDEYDEVASVTKENLGDERALKRRLEILISGSRFFPMIYRLQDGSKSKDVLVMATRTEDNPPAAVLSRSMGVELRYEMVALGRQPEGKFHFLTGQPDAQRHPDFLIQLGLSDERIQGRLKSLRESLLGVLAAIVALAAAGGSLLASRGLEPIDRVATDLERIGTEGVSWRLPEPQVRDEIGRIVHSANLMLGRLEESFQRISGFTADAAHELRTPLSAAKCRLEVSLEKDRETDEYKEAIQDALDQLEGLNKLVNDLLLLAKLDARPQSYPRQDVDLDILLRDIAEFFGIVAEQRQIRLRVTNSEECKVLGNGTLLRRLFSNLIENAIAHTPPGGDVCVAIAQSERGCNVTVSDSGRGMEQTELAKIFERFYRVGESRSRDEGGAGLGLSICKKIVESHGGLIRVSSEKGKGTTFSLYLPRN